MPKTDKELTVEECLAELRQMFPCRNSLITMELSDNRTDPPFWFLKVYAPLGTVTAMADTLSEAIAQIRTQKDSQQ